MCQACISVCLTPKTPQHTPFATIATLCLRCARRRATKGAPTTADAVTLGDAWLQRAIREGLIQPIPNARQYRWWVSGWRGWQAAPAGGSVAAQ